MKWSRRELLKSAAGAGLLLAIACVNVSSLLLVRSENRRREVSLRSALGASKARLLRQFVTEGLLLVCCGGALGLGIANRVYMLENAYYSVISPESCAAIIYRDSGRAADAAKALRLTAVDLEGLGLIDGMITEPAEGAHTDHNKAAEFVKASLQTALAELAPLSREALIEQRYDKFRRMGSFFTE